MDYKFDTISTLKQTKGIHNLVFAHQSEIKEVNNIPCFFWGNLTEPYLTAKCWATIAKVVRSSFGPIPPSLRDPIISAGEERMRYEGFSSCNGVYVRLDMKPESIDGEFIASGTTNVDFNEPMLNALNAIHKSEKVTLAVGQQNMQVITSQTKVTERKVTLPPRWVKGLTSVQLYLADMNLKFELSKIQLIQLFQGIPKGSVNGDMYIANRMGKFAFTPIGTSDAVRVGGLVRLRLIEGLLSFVVKAFIYESDDKETCAVVLEFGKMQMLLALSPDNYRGFSGEGKALENMTQELPIEWIYGLNSLLKSNEIFDPTMISIEQDINLSVMENLNSQLSSLGLLGYDLQSKGHFYRRLPFKTERILSYNPRLKNAKKLVENSEIEIVSHNEFTTYARVKGTNVEHTIIIENEIGKCTCDWYSKYQGKRGICKHVLAVKMTVAG